MSWILLVIIAHFFNAGIFIIDRYLLKKGFPNPLSYTFYVGILSIFILLLIPFGFSLPAISQIILALVAGGIWLLALFVFYTALHQGESSRVVPTVGGFIPLFTLVLSFIFLGERLNPRELIAFCFLVGGGVFLSLLVTRAQNFSSNKKICLNKAFAPALWAALFFAIYYVMTKFIFLHQSFVNGLIWIRLGSALTAAFLLIPSGFRRRIFKKTRTIEKKTLKIFFSARALGLMAGLLIYLAIYLGSVTLVNALQGTQYLFLLFLAFVLFKKIPSLREQFDKKVLVQKIIAIILISLGLIILVV